MINNDNNGDVNINVDNNNRGVAHRVCGNHRWNRNLRPQPQRFSKLVLLIWFS